MIDRRLFIMTAAAATAPAVSVSAREAASFEGLLDRTFAGGGAPALAGAVIGTEGLLWSGVRGARRADGDDPAGPDDLWHLGSNTKAMTTALYARLVEQVRIDWGAGVVDLFPDIAVDDAWRETPLEDLMSHRAGLLDAPLLRPETMIAGVSDTRPLDQQRTDLTRRALSVRPTGVPTAFDYGNMNYVVVGAAIERLTGVTWEDAIRDHLFDPLGMTTAGFGAPGRDGTPQPAGHRAFGGRLLPMAANETGSDNPPFLGPAGTAHMSLADYAKFLRLFLTRGDGFLSPVSIDHMTTPHHGRDYGLGWGFGEHRDWAGGKALFHEGSNTLWHAVTLVAPERGLAFVGVANAFDPQISPARALALSLAQTA